MPNGAYGDFYVAPRQNNKVVEGLFKEYYSNPGNLELPFDMELREFAVQPLSAEGYIRHLSFHSEGELLNFLKTKVPAHLFYSSAKYQLPDAKDVEKKGWMGADLLFDIDADHLCEVHEVKFCPVCGSLTNSQSCEKDGTDTSIYQEMGEECIREGAKHAYVLEDILKHDFGMEPKVYFSGNRGFHVQVDCVGECALLGSDERKEIVDYVSGDDVPDYKGSPEDPGWVGRKARGERGVVLDRQVTIDVKRLIRIPNSLHGKSGLLVKKADPRSFTPRVSELSPFKGAVSFLPFLTINTKLFDVEVSVEKGKITVIPTSLGVLLHLKGLGEILAHVG
nr:DNA primase small subunit PriS [Sulfuracidifex tepidarius]